MASLHEKVMATGSVLEFHHHHEVALAIAYRKKRESGGK